MAVLGTCFHEVMEAAAEGQFEGSEAREAALNLFDRLAAAAHARSHPLLRLKFRTPDRMPYYHLLRERAAVAVGDGRQSRRAHAGTAAVVETTLSSADGLIRGRPDRLDVDSQEVVDFKTGNVPEGAEQSVSDREKRQLLLYAHLAIENGINVTRGTIVRGNGQRATVELPAAQIEAEAVRAREELADFNSAVEDGTTFGELASPDPSTCRFCSCIPFCEAFWESSNESWRETLGTHAEGVVVAVTDTVQQAIDLVSFEVTVSRGTIPKGPAWLEHAPSDWITVSDAEIPKVGSTVRVIDGRLASEEPAVIRPDRVMTSIWTAESS
jgi:RecB family exonuclease